MLKWYRGHKPDYDRDKYVTLSDICKAYNLGRMRLWRIRNEHAWQTFPLPAISHHNFKLYRKKEIDDWFDHIAKGRAAENVFPPPQWVRKLRGHLEANKRNKAMRLNGEDRKRLLEGMITLRSVAFVDDVGIDELIELYSVAEHLNKIMEHIADGIKP